MSNLQSSKGNVSVVYLPVRYGQVLGVYASQEDAIQVVNQSIAKGQLCDLVIRPVLYPQI